MLDAIDYPEHNEPPMSPSGTPADVQAPSFNAKVSPPPLFVFSFLTFCCSTAMLFVWLGLPWSSLTMSLKILPISLCTFEVRWYPNKQNCHNRPGCHRDDTSWWGLCRRLLPCTSCRFKVLKSSQFALCPTSMPQESRATPHFSKVLLMGLFVRGEELLSPGKSRWRAEWFHYHLGGNIFAVYCTKSKVCIVLS